MSEFESPATGNVPEAFIEIRFAPNVPLVTTVRRFVMEVFRQVVGRPDETERVGLTVHELMENCVKYSTTGESTLRVRAERGEAGVVTVTVTIRNRASADDIAETVRRFAAMGAATDPFQYYQVVMQESLSRTTGSGLGLARIWFEAEMALSHVVDGEYLEVSARGVLKTAEAT